LQISIVTVKTHVSQLLGNLDAHDRAQIVVIAYESGLAGQGRDSTSRPH
jgi:DNA-binding NarL/FixJ family response regulator